MIPRILYCTGLDIKPLFPQLVYLTDVWRMEFRAVDRKHLGSFEMWCWRRMEKYSWTDHVRNEEVLLKSQGAEEYPA